MAFPVASGNSRALEAVWIPAKLGESVRGCSDQAQNPIHSARSYRLAAPALNQTTGIRNWTLPERLQSGSLLHVILTFPIGLVGTIQIRLTASLGMPFLRQ